jgi:hypothetical protein
MKFKCHSNFSFFYLVHSFGSWYSKLQLFLPRSGAKWRASKFVASKELLYNKVFMYFDSISVVMNDQCVILYTKWTCTTIVGCKRVILITMLPLIRTAQGHLLLKILSFLACNCKLAISYFKDRGIFWYGKLQSYDCR